MQVHVLLNLWYKPHLNTSSLSRSWSIACQRCSNCILILDLTHGFNELGKDSCKTRWESFKIWHLVRLILEFTVYRIIPHRRQDLSMNWRQHQCWWWPGDERSQGISSHGNDLVCLEYSSGSPRRVKLRGVFYERLEWSCTYCHFNINNYSYLWAYIGDPAHQWTHWPLGDLNEILAK